MGVPVFIITCVVARLTFFLKPVTHHVSHGPGKMDRVCKSESTLPAQDIVNIGRECVMRVSRADTARVWGKSFAD